MLLMLFIYSLNLLVFSGLYMLVDRPGTFCGISSSTDSAVSFQTAFAFSLITSSTIGTKFLQYSRYDFAILYRTVDSATVSCLGILFSSACSSAKTRTDSRIPYVGPNLKQMLRSRNARKFEVLMS